MFDHDKCSNKKPNRIEFIFEEKANTCKALLCVSMFSLQSRCFYFISLFRFFSLLFFSFLFLCFFRLSSLFCAHFNSHNLWIYFILFLPVFERNKHNTIKIMKPTTKNTTNKQDTHTHRRQKYSFYTCEQLDENGMAKTKPTKE